MSAEQFTRRWAYMVAMLAALIAASPYFVQMLLQNSTCFHSENACASMAEVYAHYGRSLILIIVLIPLCVTIAGRALAVGVFAWAFPFALLMLAGALPLLHSIGAPAGTESLSDALSEPAAMPLLFFVVLLLALSAHPDEVSSGAATAWRTVLGFVVVATVFVTAPVWLVGFAEIPYIGQFSVPIAVNFAKAHAMLGIAQQLVQIGFGCLVAFIVCAAGLVFSGSSGTHRLARA
jgi:hypothetical protein